MSDSAAVIPQVLYVERPGAPPGFQMFETSEIAHRVTARGLDPYAPSRLGFHLLIGIREGSIECAVDFVPCAVEAGEWLWIRAGQVHQYLTSLLGPNGVAIAFATTFLDPATVRLIRLDDPLRQQIWSENADAQEAVSVLVAALDREYSSLGTGPLDVHFAVLRHLTSALLLTFSKHDRVVASPSNPLFDDFRHAVERDFRTSHRIKDYADSLQYSTRSLTRAVVSATGRGAKQYLDDRILLESKRMLVHSDLGIGTLARQLGFTTPTEFARFFRSRAGMTALAFRDSQRPRRSGSA